MPQKFTSSIRSRSLWIWTVCAIILDKLLYFSAHTSLDFRLIHDIIILYYTTKEVRAVSRKEQAKDYILHLIEQKERHYAAKAAETLSISRSTIYNYVSELYKDGLIAKDDNGNYSLAVKSVVFSYKNDQLREERVFDRDIKPLVSDLPANVFEAWKYSFSEMMNNAIEHSEAELITFRVDRTHLSTKITIMDNGVGIFNKIRRYFLSEYNEDYSLEECMSLLFAGKFTTAKERHSGEGIFFTSHVMDTFYILSDNLLFTRNNFVDGYINAEIIPSGTLVSMELSNKSHKTVREIFGRYSNIEDGFSRTNVPIVHMFTNGYPVSRSEARRLGTMLSRFREAVLDFSGVQNIGQAFAHELFIVWQRDYPHVKLTLVNMSENVEFMIQRTSASAQNM